MSKSSHTHTRHFVTFRLMISKERAAICIRFQFIYPYFYAENKNLYFMTKVDTT